MLVTHQCSRCGTTVSEKVLGGLCHHCVGRRLVACKTGLALPRDVRRRVGPWDLKRRLGEGGCGVAYEALQQGPVRHVAVKILKPVAHKTSIADRFESERKALCLMDHPGIPRLFRSGLTVRGHPFLVMELVRGVGIKDYCGTNQLQLEARVRLFLGVCQAVEHAHGKGIVHCDIKPSNILVTSRKGKPQIKLIDFGIAAAINSQAKKPARNLGTPGYMSPEQSARSKGRIDQRSDIYSLGVLLRELVSWRTRADTRAGNALGTRPGLSRDLALIGRKCLEEDPARRYWTVNDLAEDIRGLDDGSGRGIALRCPLSLLSRRTSQRDVPTMRKELTYPKTFEL